MNLLFKITLSAILFNLPFFFLDQLGFLVLFFLIPLFYVFKHYSHLGFFIGFFWGFLVFSSQLFWLLILLITKSEATVFLSFVLYLVLILYSCVITGLFFVVISNLIKISSRLFVKLLIFFVGLFLYFGFLTQYSLIILGRIEGYPFINPLIPLARYKFFVLIINFILNLWSTGVIKKININKLSQTKIFYLKPPDIKGVGESNPNSYGQQIYHSLNAMNLFKYKDKYKNLIIVSPESTFPFPINKYKELISFWSNVLTENTYFFLGTLRMHGEKTYQNISAINKGLIINFYDKTHLVPFVEELNMIFNKFSWSKNIFLNGKKNLQRSFRKSLNDMFFIYDDLYIIPQICSEFFFNFTNSMSQKFVGKRAIIFLFVNDSWFVNYFRKIIKNLVYIKTIQNGMSILYVNHENYELINS